MDILLIGTSHRHASADLRARTRNDLGGLFTKIVKRPPRSFQQSAAWAADAGVAEVFVLTTCNRAEMYVLARDADRAARVIVDRLQITAGVAQPHIYQARGAAAIGHLCRVACGLDSMILGEAEILGQIRRAAAAAREMRATGVYLDRVIAGALRAGGRARAETRIGVGVFSAATAAVSLAEHHLGGLAGVTALVVGAGQAGRQAARRLARRGAGRLLIASRSPHHAAEAARESGAELRTLSEIASAIREADLVIAAINRPGWLLDATAARTILTSRTAGPLLIIDISVPRVVDPDVSALPGVTLRGIDDLGDLVTQASVGRQREIPHVEAIAADEAARAWAQFHARVTRQSSVA